MLDAFKLLDEQLEFYGSLGSSTTAAGFFAALMNFAKLTQSARMTSLVVEGQNAALLYDCSLPAPVGTLTIASFFRVRNLKIDRYETILDTAQVRKLLEREPKGPGG